MRLHATEELQIVHGITGNKYVLTTDRDKLVKLCGAINKASSSIRWVQRYGGCWVIRIKDAYRKQKLSEYNLSELTDKQMILF